MNEITEMLQRGIAAAKAGDREMARDFLTRVVERDERNLKAWLWLSQVVTDPEEREICLENVLAIDPDNKAAQHGLEVLRKETQIPSRSRRPPATRPSQPPDRQGAPTLAAALLRGSPDVPQKTEPSEPDDVYIPPSLEESYSTSTRRAAPTLAASIMRRSKDLPEEPIEKLSISYTPLIRSAETAVPRWSELERDGHSLLGEFDNEYLCPYCAESTGPKDQKCAACEGQLWRSERRLPERSNLLWLTIFVLTIAIVWQLFAFSIWGFVKIQPFFSSGDVKTLDEFVGLYLGQHTVSPDVAESILELLPPRDFWLFVLSLTAQLVLILLVYLRWPPFYWFAVGLAGLDLLYAAAKALGIPQPNWQSIIDVIVALLLVILLIRIQEDFMLQRERILSVLDKGIRSHSGFFLHGREYAKKKMWTLAALHFQRAVANAPTTLAYHLGLASAYLELKRYERAQSAIKEAQRLAPDDAEVRKLADQIANERFRQTGA